MVYFQKSKPSAKGDIQPSSMSYLWQMYLKSIPKHHQLQNFILDQLREYKQIHERHIKIKTPNGHSKSWPNWISYSLDSSAKMHTHSRIIQQNAYIPKILYSFYEYRMCLWPTNWHFWAQIPRVTEITQSVVTVSIIIYIHCLHFHFTLLFIPAHMLARMYTYTYSLLVVVLSKQFWTNLNCIIFSN